MRTFMLLRVWRKTRSVDAETKLEAQMQLQWEHFDQLVLSWLNYARGNVGLDPTHASRPWLQISFHLLLSLYVASRSDSEILHLLRTRQTWSLKRSFGTPGSRWYVKWDLNDNAAICSKVVRQMRETLWTSHGTFLQQWHRNQSVNQSKSQV